MRFEIRSGGIAAILVGLALLSGVVFGLGLLAGYDVGRESQATSEQVATAYPVQAPPAATKADGAAASSATPAALEAKAAETKAAREDASETANSSDDSDGSNSGIDESNLGGSASHSSETVAQVSPTETPSPSVSEPSGTAADSGTGMAAAEHPHPEHHKPYNIQIRAAMDLNGGNAMTKRLEGLGYKAHLVPTQIAGATWYRVEIGPYASQEEAAAAETELRQKYNSAYGGARPAPQAPAGAAQAQSASKATTQASN